jgi:hypothetical protein
MFLYECNFKNSRPEEGIFKIGWEKLTGVLDAPFRNTPSLVQQKNRRHYKKMQTYNNHSH